VQHDESKIITLGGAVKRAVRIGICSLPPRVRLQVDVVIGGLSETYGNWHLPGYRVRGRLHGIEREGQLIYFGELPQYKSWIANFFSDSVAAEPIGTYSLTAIAKRKAALSECDVLVCPSNPMSRLLITEPGWFVIPKYVKCLIDLHKPIEQLVSRHAVKDDLRIARKKNYRFEVLRHEAAFDQFYHEMFVPTTRIRHEDRANISSLETLKKAFKNGYLLAAYQENEWVAANLMVPQNGNILNWANVGWRWGAEQLMKDRVVSALMFEMLVRGKNEGYDILDLGSCNPFVNDGPLGYKLKWGAEMSLPLLGYDEDRLQGLNSYLSVHFNIESDSARFMLKNSPVMDKHDGHLRALSYDAQPRSDFKRQVEDGLPWINLANPEISG